MIGDKSVGPFAVNKGVKARLEEILSKNPNHLSAKMILLRGNALRPRKLDSYFVADELSVLLRQTSYLNKRDEDSISSGHLEKMAEEIKTMVKELTPLLDNKDRELPTKILDIKELLESIARARNKQRQDEREEKRPSKALHQSIIDDLAKFKLKYAEAKDQLDQIMSELPKT
jgi:hypothetical protein